MTNTTNKTILISTLGLILLLMFNNCGGGFNTKNLSSGNGADCTTKITAKSTDNASLGLSDGFSDSSVASEKSTPNDIRCSVFSQLHCTTRTYSPRLVNFSEDKTFCLDNSMCVPVKAFQYNTSSVLESGDFEPGAFDEGGEYNRTDVTCGYRSVSQPDHLHFIARGIDIAETMITSLQYCEEAQP